MLRQRLGEDGITQSIEYAVHDLDDVAVVLVNEQRVGPITHPDIARRRFVEPVHQEIHQPVVTHEVDLRKAFAVTPVAVLISLGLTIGASIITTLCVEVAMEVAEVVSVRIRMVAALHGRIWL